MRSAPARGSGGHKIAEGGFRILDWMTQRRSPTVVPKSAIYKLQSAIGRPIGYREVVLTSWICQNQDLSTNTIQ